MCPGRWLASGTPRWGPRHFGVGVGEVNISGLGAGPRSLNFKTEKGFFKTGKDVVNQEKVF